MTTRFSDRTAKEYVAAHRDDLIGLARDLVRCPSENTPPAGAELSCQRLLAGVLKDAGYEPEFYQLDEAPGLFEHPLYCGGREYGDRPNLAVRRHGVGGGRSLILSGHIDTVPRGSTQPWTRDPFSGAIDGNRLYGRGSNDMKAGVAINAFVMQAIAKLGVRLAGDLMFETVVDEEFGGVNGTLAGRLRGYVADAAIISEPSFLRICAGQRGGRTAHITFSAPGGVLTSGEFPHGVVDQVTTFLSRVPEFAARRKRTAPPHPLYGSNPDPAPVTVTKIWTAPWGMGEPITVPEECRVEFYWQLMPGERQEDVEREFFTWLDEVGIEPRPRVEFPIRWMPGSAIDGTHPLVRELSETAASVLGQAPPIAGIEGPCDMFVFHEFGVPAVLWGPTGGNTHAADEYVEIDSMVAAAETLLAFVCRWCGVAD